MPSLSALYQESMLKHPYGYALYEPESSKTLQPGFCGYITELGQWTPLIGVDQAVVSLGDAVSLSRNGLTPFNDFQRAPSDSRSWGPKVSGQMTQKRIDLAAGASLIPAGIPASVGALYQYSNRNGFGAILMAQSPVVKDFVYGSTSFRLWCKANSETILRRWPDVKERGLIIVTSVYGTNFAMTNAWTETEKGVTVGFNAGAIEIGEIAPSSSWYTAEGDSGWVVSKASQPDERKVVFFGGLYFKYRRLAAVLPQSHVFSASQVERAKFRDADPEAREFSVLEKTEKGESYELLVSAEEKGEMVEMSLPVDEDDDDEF